MTSCVQYLHLIQKKSFMRSRTAFCAYRTATLHYSSTILQYGIYLIAMNIKKYAMHIELLVIIFCFTLAPLWNPPEQEVRFSLWNFIVIFYISMLYFLCKMHNLLYKKKDTFVCISEGTIVFGFLTVISSCIEFLLISCVSMNSCC